MKKGITVLQNNIIYYSQKYLFCYLYIAGDLNARTKDFIIDDTLDYVFNTTVDYDIDFFLPQGVTKIQSVLIRLENHLYNYVV